MPQYKVKILKITQETPDVKTFRLEYPQSKYFGFQAGQFLMISTGYIDEKKLLVKRAFSIASAPHEKDFLEICVKRKNPPSFSAALHDLHIGDTLFIEGPFGKFTLKEPIQENTIFIAGGAGIAPIRSMIKTALLKQSAQPIKLFFSFHFPEDYIYKTELEALTSVEKKIELFASMSAKDQPFHDWNGLRGRVTGHLPLHIKKGSSYSAYLCGPPPMVTDTVKQLLELGLKEENIHKEAW